MYGIQAECFSCFFLSAQLGNVSVCVCVSWATCRIFSTGTPPHPQVHFPPSRLGVSKGLRGLCPVAGGDWRWRQWDNWWEGTEHSVPRLPPSWATQGSRLLPGICSCVLPLNADCERLMSSPCRQLYFPVVSVYQWLSAPGEEAMDLLISVRFAESCSHL